MDEIIGKYILFRKSTIKGSSGIILKSGKVLGRIVAPVMGSDGYYYIRYTINLKDGSYTSTTTLNEAYFNFVDPETHPEYFL